MANACFLRWGAFDPWKWIRGPSFLIAATSAALLLLVLLTHGVAVSRSLIAAVRAGGNLDRPIGYSVPVVFALVTGAIAAAQRRSLPCRGWRYLSFLFFKTFALAAIFVVLWVEGGAALRAAIPNEVLRHLGGGLCLAIAFIGVFDWAVVWSLADQQYRCPVCLRRLVQPVRIGTWASVLEPVTTEWICEAGHGALCVGEHDPGRADRWIELEPAATTSARAPEA